MFGIGKIGLTALALAGAISLSLVSPAQAAGRVKARGADVAESGDVVTGHVAAAATAGGGKAVRAGDSITGPAGATHGSVTAVSGAHGQAARAGSTSVNKDGSLSHQGVSGWKRANGGSGSGSNRFVRNADGSASSSHQNSGHTAAGGSYSSSGAYSRDAGGAVSGSSQTRAGGAKGTYASNTSSADGTTVHDTSATNAATGESYKGQTVYTKGQGVTHTGVCTDAGGNAIPCHWVVSGRRGCAVRVRRRTRAIVFECTEVSP